MFIRSIIIIFLLLCSTWQLAASPATWLDEGTNLGIANSLIHHGVYSLEVGPEQFVAERPFLITTNYPVILPVAASLILFNQGEPSLLVARLPMVLYLWLFCALLFILVRRLSSREWAPWLAVALVATFAPLYGNGKAVLGEVPGLVFLLAGILVLPREFKPWRVIGAGILFGLSIASKPFFLIIGPAILASELYFYWSDKKNLVKRLGLLAVGALGPVVGWLATILPSFSLSALGTTGNYYANSYAASGFLQILGANIVRFVSESTPIHFLFGMVALGIFLKKRRSSGELTAAEIIIGVFTLINFLWYLKTPGWYRYFFPAHVLVLGILPVTLYKVISRQTIATVILLFLCLIQTGQVISKANDPLYYSNAATEFVAKVPEHAEVGENILVINSPSAAFLLSNKYKLTQLLQINEQLHFGSNELNPGGVWYPYVITMGSVATTSLVDGEVILAKEYEPVLITRKYQLHKKKYYVRN